jgi:hypothetical protein
MEYKLFKDRNSSFMVTDLPKTTEEFSQFRSSALVTLRKQKRQQHILHKRLNKVNNSPGTLVSLQEVINTLNIFNIQSIKMFRKLLCEDKFDYMLLLQLKPDIVRALSKALQSKNNEMVYEISWCFANLALGPPMLVDQVGGFISVFTDIAANSEDKSLAEQACWVLGNLAADNLVMKDCIRRMPGLVASLSRLLALKNPNLNSVVCWALCNIIRSQCPCTDDLIEAGVLAPVLDISHRPYSPQVVESLWLLSFLTISALQEVYVQVYTAHNLQLYLKYLEYDDINLLIPIIRIIGNAFVYYPSLDYLFSNSLFIDHTIKLINSPNTQVKKEIIWMVSNIFALDYVKPFINYSGDSMIKILLSFIDTDEQKLITELGICIYNLSEVYNSLYFQRILHYGKTNLIDFYINIIENVPIWVKFDIEVAYDIDLLKISLGFIALAFEFTDKSKDIDEYLYSDKVRDAIEDCKDTIRKGKNKYSNDEAFMISQCDVILKRFIDE